MMFIGTYRKVIFTYCSTNNPKEKAISNHADVVAEIESIMSFGFLDSIQNCLLSKPQRDTDCGYWLTKKEGDKIINFCMAAKDVSGKVCVNKKLSRLLKLTHDLFRED